MDFARPAELLALRDRVRISRAADRAVAAGSALKVGSAE